MELLSIFLLSLIGLLQMNDTTEVAFVGDAMQHGPQIKAAAQADGSFDYSDCFSLVESDIKSADYAVANLECPLGGAPYRGYPVFSAPDEFAVQLQRSGFDMLLTANNHCMDCGNRGLLRTIKTLDDMGIAHVGTYADGMARVNSLPCIVDVNGVKMAFLAYTYGTNGIVPREPVVVDMIKRDRIAEDVRNARRTGAELVCACLHWGNEYESLPSHYQRSTASFLKDAGVDVIIGSHPHVLQPMELDYSANTGTGHLLVYSLGNFISNQNDLNSRGGAMVKLYLARYEDAPVILDAQRLLFFCQKPLGREDNYKLIPQNLEDSVRFDSKTAFKQFMLNAENLFKTNNKNIR